MSAISSAIPALTDVSHADSIRRELSRAAAELLSSLPNIGQLSPEARRGIVSRYSSVLEGNFIYWMTGAYLAARSAKARSIIEDNLRTEVRDCHPGMLRRFALAAGSVPRDSDAMAVYRQLSAVRRFVARLLPVPLIAMMAFFEDFIQGFMAYLEELARLQGSSEKEYTEVHGVCDIEHSEELFHALELEMALAGDPRPDSEYLFEGVTLLESLIQAVVFTPRDQAVSTNVN